MSTFKDYLVHFFKGTDKLLVLYCMLASGFGILSVYSATMRLTNNYLLGMPRDATIMILAVVVGFIIATIISLVDYDIICKLWPIWAALGVGLMVVVILFGVAVSTGREDARIWINLGLFYFQPSELVKVFFIITFSVHLDKVRYELNKIRNLVPLLLHALIPFVLVHISGDDGSAIIFLMIAFIMLFVAGLNWKYIVGAIALVAAAIPLLWTNMSEFQKQRFVVLWDPAAYPQTAYQQTLGLSAIANGGLIGKGLFHGTYTQSGSIPVAESDMIFTVICEELGLIGGLVALAILVAIMFRIIRDGNQSIAGPAHPLCYGIASMVGIQTLINIAMCLRIGPVIGITLPFFSAGGSSTLCLYAGIGLILSVYHPLPVQRGARNQRGLRPETGGRQRAKGQLQSHPEASQGQGESGEKGTGLPAAARQRPNAQPDLLQRPPAADAWKSEELQTVEAEVTVPNKFHKDSRKLLTDAGSFRLFVRASAEKRNSFKAIFSS